MFVERLGFVGLALGTSVTAILNALLLAWAVHRKLKWAQGEISWLPVLSGFALYLRLAAIMGGLVYGVDQSFGVGHPYFLRVGVGVVLGGFSYLGLSILCRGQESLEMLELFRRRWKGSRS